jgi:hypothetical protein
MMNIGVCQQINQNIAKNFINFSAGSMLTLCGLSQEMSKVPFCVRGLREPLLSGCDNNSITLFVSLAP